jgi:spore germination protein GerM
VPATQETLLSVIQVLVDGPSQEEAAFFGLGSAIPPQTSVLAASIAPGGLATVDVAGTFGQLIGAAQIEAVAQIVFTATSLPGANVSGVTFELAGQTVEVPTDSGAQAPVVNESQFQALAPTPAIHTPVP